MLSRRVGHTCVCRYKDKFFTLWNGQSYPFIWDGNVSVNGKKIKMTREYMRSHIHEEV